MGPTLETGRSLDAWVLLTGAVLLLAGGGLVLWEPFKPSRPTNPAVGSHAIAQTKNIPARLWQDPLSSVARWQSDQSDQSDQDQADEAPDADSVSFTFPADLKKLVVMPVLVYGGSYSESVEKRRRRRYAVLSASFAQDFRPTDPETIRYRPIDANGRNLRCRL